MNNKLTQLSFIILVWGLLLPLCVKGDALVSPRKQSCEQGFKEAYGLLEKGYQPYLMNGKECPVSHQLLTWIWLLKHGKNATLDDYRLFLEHKNHWPLLDKIQEGGENTLSHKTVPQQVLNFFKHRRPLTSLGMVHYVRALFSVGKKAEAIEKLRQFWREKNFNASNERYFYQKFKKHLTSADHQYRLDRLALEGNYYGLRRMIKRVSRRAQRIIQATSALSRFQSMADFHIRQLKPLERENVGVIFQRVKWRLKKGKSKEAQDLFLKSEQAGHLRSFHDKWFKYRYYFARSLFKKKSYARSYALLKKHGLNPSIQEQITDYAAAEWYLGWLSLRFLKKPSQAATHFRNMLDHVRTPVSKAKAIYWIGRSMEALGKGKEAATWYEKAATFPQVFYGQEALKHLGRPFTISLKSTPEPIKLRPQDQELRIAAKLLYDTNPKDIHLKSFLIHMAKNCREGDQENFIAWVKVSGFHRWLVLCSKIAGRKGVILMEDSFPLQKLSAKILSHSHLSKVFLHGLMRQESGFDQHIKSSAGAEGMMQLIPRFAKKLCRKMRIPYAPKRLTQDAHYNMRIGSFFLNSLMAQFGGNKVLTLAAYNAGEPAVNRWIKDYGDPRSKDIDTLDWIEAIPFSETRTYVMRILESLPLYAARLKNS